MTAREFLKYIIRMMKIYDVIRVEMGLKSRRDVKEYLEKLKGGSSKSLKDVTAGFHYHTVIAESEEILDQIQNELQKRGFLAELRDYEPIDFWQESAGGNHENFSM